VNQPETETEESAVTPNPDFVEHLHCEEIDQPELPGSPDPERNIFDLGLAKAGIAGIMRV